MRITATVEVDPAGTVYRSGNGHRWHWRTNEMWGPASACSSWPLSLSTATDPVSIRIEDRCEGKGCAYRWNAWLFATTRRALQDAAYRGVA